MKIISSNEKIFSNLELGKKSAYCKTYNPYLLQPIPRSINRKLLNLSTDLPFNGFDLWTFFEISFLNTNGLPISCVGQVSIPCNSINIIESKSFKLYLNSFNFSSYSSINEVKAIIEKDISKCLSISSKLVNFDLFDLSNHTYSNQFSKFTDNLCITSTLSNSFSNLEKELPSTKITNYDYDPSLLSCSVGDTIVEECLCSHLLKSNCLVTGQPDWGSIYIKYKGKKISHDSLLKYIVSFRNHNEFHEMCVERIFCDINKVCKPEKLTVFARYTRRGGIDINPFRSNFENTILSPRTIRQ